MAKKRRKDFLGIVMGRNCDHFYCWWHCQFFPAEKLMVCAVRGCRWRWEAYAEDAARIRRANNRRKRDARGRTVGVGAAG